jgi:DNA polymerase III sliding clamp (beta) subunit (PCNA family)
MHFVIKIADLVASVAMVEKAISTNDQTPVL